MERDYLTQQELQVLINTDLPSRQLETVRDIFIFSCFTSLSLYDVRNLKKENMKTGQCIEVIRHRTGNKSRIPFLPITKRIYDKYFGGIITRKDFFPDIEQPIVIYLKQIGSICGLQKRLTSITARNTFANMAYHNGVSIEVIANVMDLSSPMELKLRLYISDAQIKKQFAVFAEETKEIEIQYLQNH